MSWNGEGHRLRGEPLLYVLILNILNILCNIFPVFNARSCLNEFYLSSSMTRGHRSIIVIISTKYGLYSKL